MGDEKRAALYARVSTGFQLNGTSVESQIDEIRRWATAHGCIIAAEYVDEAVSGQTTRREAFQRMLDDSRRGLFDIVLCWKHSRLFRSLEDAIIYKHMLLKRGVRLVSITEPLEDTPTGRLMESIIVSIDEFYSANLAQDSLRGLCELARQGYACGGNPPYGYKVVQVANHKGYLKRKYEISKPEADVVRRMFRLGAEGRGVKEIAKCLNDDGIPSPSGGAWYWSTIYTIMVTRQEQYLGNLIYNRKGRAGPLNVVARHKPREEWVIVPGAIPPIISQEMADAYNKARKKATR